MVEKLQLVLLIGVCVCVCVCVCYMYTMSSTSMQCTQCIYTPTIHPVLMIHVYIHRCVYIWDTVYQRLVYKLPGHLGSVNDVDFHPKEPISELSNTVCTING